MKDVTDYVVNDKGKYWCDTEDEGKPVIRPGQKVMWKDTTGKVRKGQATENFRGRDDDVVELALLD